MMTSIKYKRNKINIVYLKGIMLLIAIIDYVQMLVFATQNKRNKPQTVVILIQTIILDWQWINTLVDENVRIHSYDKTNKWTISEKTRTNSFLLDTWYKGTLILKRWVSFFAIVSLDVCCKKMSALLLSERTLCDVFPLV